MRKFLLLIPALFVWSCQSTGSDATEVQEVPVEATATQRNTALDSLNEIIRYTPNDLEALEARAEVYLRQQNLKYAAADVAAVLQLDSARTKALELWGDISFSTNQTRQSRDAWTRCMEEDPQNISCRLKMAELYHVVTEFEKSAKLTDRVLEIDPQNAEAHFLKGLLMRDAIGDTTRALEWFQKAIDIDPEYIEALDMCGVLYSALGSPLAGAYFNRLVELQPQNRIAYYNRGMFQLGMKEWNRALEDFTKSTQLNPDDLESWFNLGYIHLQLQLYPEARGYFNTALRIQPVNHRALYARGYCNELLGDINNAEADYLEALSYNPDHQGSKEGLQRMKIARAQVGQ